VWGRRQTRIEECPKSFITGESLALIEEYAVMRRLGIPDSLDIEARKADAFLLLKDLVVKEESYGTSQH
jgi:hypothetical protein